MGSNFHMRAAKAAPDGSLTYLDGPNTSFFIRHNTLFELIDAIDSVKHWRTPTKTTFPWYQSCFGYDRPGGPSVADCFRPRDVLESLQGIERELQRNSKKYPAYYLFWVPAADGAKASHRSLPVWYRDRPCRLFSDEQGCWAVETSPGPREGVHHDLKELPEVRVRLASDGPEVAVGLERVSFLTEWAGAIQEMKRVCLTAMQANGLIMTAAG